MQVLVTPERTVWHMESRSDLKAYTDAHKIGWKLAGNLRQLLGYDKVCTHGDNARSGRSKASQYFLLSSATWMYRVDDSVVIALFGSQKASARVGGVQQRCNVRFGRGDGGSPLRFYSSISDVTWELADSTPL